MVEFAAMNSVFADLVIAYPGFAFALATGYGRREDRLAAADLLMQGYSMIELADELGLPRWLRKLPPEAFVIPLSEFSRDRAFNRRLGDLVKRDPAEAARWLRWIGVGRELAGDDFALWLACQQIYAGYDEFWENPFATRQALEPLALYAWHSQHLVGEPVQFLARHWNGKISFAKAVAETKTWLDRIKLTCAKSDTGQTQPPWFPEWKHGSVKITPLMRQRDLNHEGDVMCHCVASYGSKVRAGLCCIYALRKGRKHLATIELVRCEDNMHKARIAQISAYCNDEPSRTAKRYIDKWFHRNEDIRLPDVPHSSSSVARWRNMWHHYHANRRGLVSPLLSDRWTKITAFDAALDRLVKLAS